MNWRIVVASQPPDQYGRIDPQHILAIQQTNTESIDQAIDYAKGTVQYQRDKVQYVGLYRS